MAVQAVEPGLQPLHRGLQRAQRRLWLQILVRTAARGICVGLALTLVAALLTGWQAPAEILSGLWWASILCPVAGIIAALFLKPSQARAARVTDLQLQLHQQLGTAEELLSRNADGTLVSMQLASAASVADEISVARAFPLVPRREMAVALLLAILTAGVFGLANAGIILPNPLAAIRLPSLTQRTDSRPDQKLFSQQQANPTQTQSPSLESFRQS
ncbi:MAG TPA: hypothetical protein VHS28_10045, partial [Chloroflexota bacterium]|nr:hypothetical protein [Chloroflexota bacterium]